MINVHGYHDSIAHTRIPTATPAYVWYAALLLVVAHIGLRILGEVPSEKPPLTSHSFTLNTATFARHDLQSVKR